MSARTDTEILAELAAVARLVPFDPAAPGGLTWFDVLFDAGAGGPAAPGAPAGPADPTAPDRALLAALAREYAALDAHLDRLPDRAHRWWLTEILRLAPLPARPDRVVAQIAVDPALAPVVVPAGTLLRGGRDAFGAERRYRTLDPLTAHGARLFGIRTLVPGGNAGGRPGVVAEAPEFPLVPAAGVEAEHVLRISSPVLAFDHGDLTVRIEFAAPATAFPADATVAVPADAGWRWTLPDGTVSAPVAAAVAPRPAGCTVTLTLTGACGAPAGALPWVECVIPPHVPVPEAWVCTGVRVAVVGRSRLVPEAGFGTAGALDVSTEFSPFGATAGPGDAFYVRCDEAFGKPLAWVSIEVRQVPDSTPVTGVRWQRRAGGQWQDLRAGTGSLYGIFEPDVDGAPVGSERFAVAGRDGHYLRAYLEADLGWRAYQAAVAAFSTAAGAGRPPPELSPPPMAPLATDLTISYRTVPVDAAVVEARSGWRHTVMSGRGPYRPFRRAVSDDAETGMVAVGFDLPASAAGSSVSVYLGVESSTPCASTDDVAARWQWWDGAVWQPLPAVDGSRQLREAGVLRFLVPADWAAGCADVGAAEGRWIRLVTSAPERLGVLAVAVVDVVGAEFVSALADPGADPSSAAAVDPAAIKGTVAALAGVRKVRGIAAIRGRAPETDELFLARGSSRVRHRDRAVLPWDYEQHVRQAFPEVAAVRCLPHTDRDGAFAPGHVGLVVVPDRPGEPAPRPSVSLTERILDTLRPLAPVGARLAVLCPAYRPVTVVASVRLRRGLAALTGTQALLAGLAEVLAPGNASGPVGTAGGDGVRWGRALYPSALVAYLERRPEVDVVTDFRVHDGSGPVEVVEVDPDRGLYCSSGVHRLTCEEQL